MVSFNYSEFDFNYSLHNRNSNTDKSNIETLLINHLTIGHIYMGSAPQGSPEASSKLTCIRLYGPVALKQLIKILNPESCKVPGHTH